MADSTTEYRFVWAKLPGYAPWPGVVLTAPDNAPLLPRRRLAYHWVYFFGTHNYSWVDSGHVSTMVLMDTMHFRPERKYKHSASLKKAVTEAQAIITNYTIDQKNFTLDIKPYIKKVHFADKKLDATTDEDVASTSGKPRRITFLRKRPASVDDSGSTSSGSEIMGIPVIRKPLKLLMLKRQSYYSRNKLQKKKSPIKTEDKDRLLMPPPKKISRPMQLKNSADESDTNPLNKTYGFMRLNFRTCNMIRHLLYEGYTIHLWNADAADLKLYEETLVQFATDGPGDLKVYETREKFITATEMFLMYTEDAEDTRQARAVLKIDDPNENIFWGKNYIEMTTTDCYTSIELYRVLEDRNITYLEVQLNGNNWDFLNGNVLALCSGDKYLYLDLRDGIFSTLCKNSIYTEIIGKACRANAILQLLRSNLLCGYTEVMALANRLGIGPETFTHIFDMTELNTSFLYNKGQMIISGNYSKRVEDSVRSLHKDARLGLEISDRVRIPVPLAAKSNQILKQTRSLGYHDEDIASVYATVK